MPGVLKETVFIGEIEIGEDGILANPITIYDKAETASIRERELKDLIKVFRQNG